jgi:uncharacterized Tic20 family protein
VIIVSQPEQGMKDMSIGMPSREARTWAMWCHLGSLAGYFLLPLGSIIVPVIIWMLKRDQDPFIDEQGRESINFQISLLIYGIISAILILVVVGFVLLGILYFAGIILVIIASIRANDGQSYRYPLTIRLL